MSDNLDDKSNETYNDNIGLQNSIFSPDSNIVKYESCSFKFSITTSPSLIINNILFFNNFTTKFFRELLQELYVIVREHRSKYTSDIEDKLKDFTNNFLFEYDLDPKNVFNIMTSSPQNICCYSSLIGFFYQHGIGCEVDKIKAFETFSNAVNNNQNVESTHFSFDEAITTFCNDDIKKLNEITLQYFYSIFLYKDIILYRKNNYKLHIKSAERG